MFGNYVESKLQEFDKETGKQVYSLDELLKAPTPPSEDGEDEDEMGDILDALAPFLGKSGVAVKEAGN